MKIKKTQKRYHRIQNIIENRMSDLKDREKRMSEKEKKEKNADETLKIIKKILDYNKDAQNYFHRASNVDKGKSEPKTEKSIAERVKLKNNRICEIKKEEKNINNKLFNCYFSKYQNPSDMYKKLLETKGKKMKIKCIQSKKYQIK